MKNLFHHRWRVHGELGVSESEHHVHGAHGARRGARRRRDEAGRSSDATRCNHATRSAGRAERCRGGGNAVARNGAGRVAKRTSTAARGERFKQSVSRWCYGRMSARRPVRSAKAIGYSSVELLSEQDWAVRRRSTGSSAPWPMASAPFRWDSTAPTITTSSLPTPSV